MTFSTATPLSFIVYQLTLMHWNLVIRGEGNLSRSLRKNSKHTDVTFNTVLGRNKNTSMCSSVTKKIILRNNYSEVKCLSIIYAVIVLRNPNFFATAIFWSHAESQLRFRWNSGDVFIFKLATSSYGQLLHGIIIYEMDRHASNSFLSCHYVNFCVACTS